MKYRNTKTGIEIETACAVTGDNWEPMVSPQKEPQPEKEKKTVKKGGRKK